MFYLSSTGTFSGGCIRYFFYMVINKTLSRSRYRIVTFWRHFISEQSTNSMFSKFCIIIKSVYSSPYQSIGMPSRRISLYDTIQRGARPIWPSIISILVTTIKVCTKLSGIPQSSQNIIFQQYISIRQKCTLAVVILLTFCNRIQIFYRFPNRFSSGYRTINIFIIQTQRMTI